MLSQIYWLAAARWPASNPKLLKIEIKEPNNAMHRTGMCAVLKIMSVLHANTIRFQMLPLNHRKNAREKEYILVRGFFFNNMGLPKLDNKESNWRKHCIALHRWIYILLANAFHWLKYSMFTGKKIGKIWNMRNAKKRKRKNSINDSKPMLVGWLPTRLRDKVEPNEWTKAKSITSLWFVRCVDA